MDAKKFQKFQKELAGMIVEQLNKDDIKDGKDEAAEELARIKEQNSDLMKQIKDAQAKEVKLAVPGSEETKNFKYRGYDIRKQGLELGIADNDERERHAKFIIDVLTKADMNEGTVGQGGYLVPDEYEATILGLARKSSVGLQEARVWNMGTDVLRIPKENGAVTVDYAAEASANSQSEPTVAEMTLTAKRFGAYSQVTNELLEDSMIDITSWITELFAEALGQSVDDQLFNGSSTTADLHGACGATISGSGAYTALAFGDFSSAIAQLETGELQNAKFYMNKALNHYVRTMVDASNRLIYQFPNAGAPGQIYGYPLILVPKINSAPAAGEMGFVFGDLKKGAAIGMRRGMSIKANPYILMKEHKTQFVTSMRFDTNVAVAGALVEWVPSS
jgi:HK97 family phage major capsid protein